MMELFDWIPNLHALLVHLPIGLLVSAAAIDLVAVLRRNPSTVVTVSTALYVAGTATLIAAYLTGRSAAPEVYTPGMAHAVVTRHWDWGFWCTCYFSLLTATRVGIQLGTDTTRRITTLAFWGGGLAGLLLLANTADLGGQLVYEHGVGVAAPQERGRRNP